MARGPRHPTQGNGGRSFAGGAVRYPRHAAHPPAVGRTWQGLPDVTRLPPPRPVVGAVLALATENRREH